MIKEVFVMKKCDCYHERTERHYFTDFERGFNAAMGKIDFIWRLK